MFKSSVELFCFNFNLELFDLLIWETEIPDFQDFLILWILIYEFEYAKWLWKSKKIQESLSKHISCFGNLYLRDSNILKIGHLTILESLNLWILKKREMLQFWNFEMPKFKFWKLWSFETLKLWNFEFLANTWYLWYLIEELTNQSIING